MRYRGIRKIKTTQERRNNQTGWSRSARNKANLVNYYDDIPAFTQRTWKKFRKTQYKIIQK